MYKTDSQKRSQHLAVRQNVGWYYFTHNLVEVTGKDAGSFLDYVCLNSLAKTGIGRAKYTTLLNEEGKIIDDVIVFHIAEDHYWVSTLYPKNLIAWFDSHKGSNEIAYQDITSVMDMFSVQGPRSREFMNAILAENLDDQKYFSIRDNKIDDMNVKISRNGFTGELGYEIYVASIHKKDMTAKLTEAGKAFDAVRVTELEVMTLTLPTEKGYNLMSDIKNLSPLEVEPGAKINWEKEFIGKDALRAAYEAGPTRQLLGFTVEGDSLRIRSRNWNCCGDRVIVDGQDVGEVTKLTYSYTLDTCLGFALIDTEKAKVGDKIKIKSYDGVLTDRIWYDPENLKPLGKA